MNEDLIIERIVRRQEIANEKILKEIAQTLYKIGELKYSDLYTINQQLKYGESLDKIVKILSETGNINKEEIYKMLENSSIEDLKRTKEYFDARGIDFIPYEENTALQMQVESIARTTNRIYENIAQTTGITYINFAGKKVTKPLVKAYYEIVDEAIYNVQQGKETFYNELKKQLETIGQSGIQKIEYESGYHRRIDSSLRMSMQDGLNQLNIKQQEIVGEQFDADGWEVSVHEFPAEDHAMIQGHTFNDDEYNKLQDYNFMGDITDIEGNTYTRSSEEHIRAIGTLNCYHRAFRVVLGVSKPRYTEEQLQEIIKRNDEGFEFEGEKYSLYEGTQLQRRLELEIKRTRETKLMLNDKTDIDKYKAKERQLLKKYRGLVSVSGLPSKIERARLLIKQK